MAVKKTTTNRGRKAKTTRKPVEKPVEKIVEPLLEPPKPEEPPKMGRPLKFEDSRTLQIKIDEYFGDCDPHIAKRQVINRKADGGTYIGEEDYITAQKPYTITGLALHLDTSRDVLIDYQSGKYDGEDSEFSNTIIRAKNKIATFAETMLYTKGAATGAIFWLKNNAGWRDVSRQEHTGEDGAPIDHSVIYRPEKLPPGYWQQQPTPQAQK